MVITALIPCILEIGTTIIGCIIIKVKSKYRVKPGRRTKITEEELQRRLYKKYQRMKKEKMMKRN